VPIIVATTAELRSPGDHTNIEIAGVPVLVMRGRNENHLPIQPKQVSIRHRIRRLIDRIPP
jgi:hypothetical protein